MAESQKIRCDVAVVGSGPGGATVARDLTLGGADVVLLERGGDNPPRGNAVSAIKYVGGAGFLNKGVFITREGYQIVRCLTLGGTSLMYLGCAWDPPSELMNRWGIDLTVETAQIKQELPVGPLPDRLIGPRARALTDSATSLGYDWKKIPKLVQADNCRTNCGSCMFGCPHKAKWHARDWVEDVRGKGLRVMTDTRCVQVTGKNGAVAGVTAFRGLNTRVEVEARAVVVAAGGVGSPGLLQRSGLTEAGDSFFFDPFIVVSGYVDGDFSPNREFPMATGMHLPEEGVMVTDMPVPWPVLADNALFAKKPHRMLPAKNMVGLLVKVRDDMEGSISADEKIGSKPLTPVDQAKLRLGEKISCRLLANIGAKNIWSSLPSAAHPGGTCRIGKVVDRNLETRIKNLFVADASVIPEPWGLPPTLTVLSLARRLSRHLFAEVL
ncbi:MAG: GMC family oxidoreductase N-terminal domain-containing protein [Thermodesulfobacteriota bacterium]